MNETLKPFIEKALSTIDSTQNFLEAQIPEVITQLLLWHGVYNLIIFITSTIMIIMAIVMVSKLLKDLVNLEVKWIYTKQNGYEDLNVEGFLAIVKAICIFLLLLLGILNLNLIWLQIWIAPKVFLIEYAATLVTGK